MSDFLEDVKKRPLITSQSAKRMSEIIDDETKLEMANYSSNFSNDFRPSSEKISEITKSKNDRNTLHIDTMLSKKHIVDVPRPQDLDYNNIPSISATPTHATGFSAMTDEGSIYSYLVKSPKSNLNTPLHSINSSSSLPASPSSLLSPSVSLTNGDFDETERNETSHTAVLFNNDLLGSNKTQESRLSSTLSFAAAKSLSIPSIPALGLTSTGDVTDSKVSNAYNDQDAFSDSDDATTTDGQQLYTMTEAFEIKYDSNNHTMYNTETLNVTSDISQPRTCHTPVPSFPLPAAPGEQLGQLSRMNSHTLIPTQITPWVKENHPNYYSMTAPMSISPKENTKILHLNSYYDRQLNFSSTPPTQISASTDVTVQISDDVNGGDGRYSTDQYQNGRDNFVQHQALKLETEDDVESQQLKQLKPSYFNRKPKKLVKVIGISFLVLVILVVVIATPIAVQTRKKQDRDNQPIEKKKRDENYMYDKLDALSLADQITFENVSLPENLKGTIYDTSTWLDTTGFNTTFTNVTVGGLPIMGLNTTFDNTAQPNPLVPPIKDGFPYGSIPIRGVNLGGWLVLEPFITPSFFEKYDPSLNIVDEWTLTEYLTTTNGISGVKKLLEAHYSTFITEETFKEIKEAGLDHVRIPIGYWAVKTWEGDNFLPLISWRYLLRGIEWARKYGIRVNLDLHSLPGGQNGWNHSGRQNVLNWLNNENGDIYGQRSLEVHAALAEFFSQPRYTNLVTIYGLANEPRMSGLNENKVIEWTKNAYNMVRSKGFQGVISFGDGFRGVGAWHGEFEAESFPKMALDVHQYTIFDNGLLQLSHSEKMKFVCNVWTNDMRHSTNLITGHGPTFVGEWSQADNDCTKYLNNVGAGSRWEGDLYQPNPDKLSWMACNGNTDCTCSLSNVDPQTYSPAYKQFLLDFAEAQMDSFENNGGWGSIYWTWDTERIESSQWSYKKSRDAGTMPRVAYERAYKCSMGIRDYTALGLPEYY